MFYAFLDSPVGRLLVAGNATHIKGIDLRAQPAPGDWTEREEPLTECIRQLNEYFRGDLERGFIVEPWLSTSQFVSIFVIAAGIGMYVKFSLGRTGGSRGR